MIEARFIPTNTNWEPSEGSVTVQSPSNIALVKYWGKTEPQLPLNPSISFTLDACHTRTTLTYRPREEEAWFEVYVDGKRNLAFEPKITTFFERIAQYCPFLPTLSLRIETSNTFPHSSGIASSASGMSALALALVEIEARMAQGDGNEIPAEKASFLARLGSGSACRSLDGGLVVWGEHADVPGSSDLFGIPLPSEIHPVFKSYRDTIMLVHHGEKVVSSTVGHGLMHGHPYANARFEQARTNMSRLIPVIRSGDLQNFVDVVEEEALALHAMMLTSSPNFILMKPGTLRIIEAVRAYRQETGSMLCFTLDAGANVHLLFPENEEDKVYDYIKNHLAGFTEKGEYLCDAVGGGAKIL